jgi:hypothetical protein
MIHLNLELQFKAKTNMEPSLAWKRTQAFPKI